jgi:hypothetical protein
VFKQLGDRHIQQHDVCAGRGGGGVPEHGGAMAAMPMTKLVCLPGLLHSLWQWWQGASHPVVCLGLQAMAELATLGALQPDGAQVRGVRSTEV